MEGGAGETPQSRQSPSLILTEREGSALVLFKKIQGGAAGGVYLPSDPLEVQGHVLIEIADKVSLEVPELAHPVCVPDCSSYLSKVTEKNAGFYGSL